MGTETGISTKDRHVSPNFITEIIDEDLRQGRYEKVVTRFPPEPNGYLHIGHAKSIALNFGLALDYGGECNLRFDDTNPETESLEYVEAMKRDIRWLGYAWTRECYASDYFGRLYECAVQLIREDKAYVDSLSDAEISEYRGTIIEPGRPSPYRARSPGSLVPTVSGALRKTWNCSSACAKASFPTAPTSCAPRSISPAET